MLDLGENSEPVEWFAMAKRYMLERELFGCLPTLRLGRRSSSRRSM